MSSTMVITETMATTPTKTATLRTDHPSPGPTPSESSRASCCPSCGSGLPHVDHELVEAQSRIAELESQVRLLNEKASAAVDKWADYEDELTKLRAASKAGAKGAAGAVAADGETPSTDAASEAESTEESRDRASSRQSLLQVGTNRISQLLTRKSTPNLRSGAYPHASAHYPLPNGRPPSSPGLPPPPAPPPKDAAPGQAEALLKALTREKSLRKEAEGRLTETSKEVEELSAALFEQANEMVAGERRERAKLEERVGELEKRDFEKRKRLDKLEGAMTRIERVRTLLAEDDKA